MWPDSPAKLSFLHRFGLTFLTTMTTTQLHLIYRWNYELFSIFNKFRNKKKTPQTLKVIHQISTGRKGGNETDIKIQ